VDSKGEEDLLERLGPVEKGLYYSSKKSARPRQIPKHKKGRKRDIPPRKKENGQHCVRRRNLAKLLQRTEVLVEMRSIKTTLGIEKKKEKEKSSSTASEAATLSTSEKAGGE